MLTKRIRRIIKSASLLILLSAALLLFANHLVQQPDVQAFLVKRLSDLNGFNISTGKIELNLLHGIGISVDDFIAHPENGPKIFASKLRVTLEPWDLLKGRIVPEDIYLVRPRIELDYKYLKRPPEDPHNAEKGIQQIFSAGIKAFHIEGGEISVPDKGIYLKNLQLTLLQKEPAASSLAAYGRGNAVSRGEEIPFSVRGDVIAGTEKQPRSYLDLTLETGKSSINALPRLKSFPVTGGAFHTSLWLKGSLHEELSIGGNIHIDELDFAFHHKDRQKQFKTAETDMVFSSTISKGRITIPELDIKGSDRSFAVKFAMDFNNKADPFLDLEIKSDFTGVSTLKEIWPAPLLYPWFDERLLPILESGRFRLNPFTAKGNIDQFRNPGLPENRSVFELKLDCEDLTFAGNGVPLPLEKVSGEVIWKNRDFFIKDMTGRFGDSVISSAGLSITRTADGSRSTGVQVKGSFDLEDLMRQKELNLIPENVRGSFDMAGDLNGRLDFQADFDHQSGWEYPVISSGEFIFRECGLELEKLRLPLKIREAGFYIYKDNQNQFTGTGYWGNSEIRTTGRFEISGNSFDLQNMDILTRSDINQLLPLLYNTGKFPLHFSRPVTGHISMEQENGYLSFLGNIDLKSSSAESESFTVRPPGENNSILLDIRIAPGNRIDINSLLFRLNNSYLELKGSHDLNEKDLFEFELSSPGLSLESMGIGYKEKELPIKGTIKGILKAKIPFSNPGETSLTGQVYGNDLFFNTDISAKQVKACNFSASLSGKDIIIEQLEMTIGESPVKIAGNLAGWDKIKGSLSVTSDFIDFFDIFPQGTKTERKGPEEEGLWKRLDLAIDVDALRGKWKGLTWGPLEADLRVINGDIHIRNSAVELENGMIRITGHKQSGTGSGMLLECHASLKNQPVDKLLEDIGFSDRGIRGNLDMEAELLIQAETGSDLIPGLSGKAGILINEGLIKNPRMFLKILDFMSLQNILKDFYRERPPHLREEGLYFKKMQGDATIENGIARTENFVMISPALNAVAIGEEDLVKRTHNLKLFTQPLGTLESILSKLPIVGKILLGDEKKSILTVGYNVTGPWADPEVRPVPLESFGKGILGILERTLLTPIKIIEDIHGVTDRILNDDPSANQ